MCTTERSEPEVQVFQARIPVAFSMEKQLLNAKEDQDFRQHSRIGWGSCCWDILNVYKFMCIYIYMKLYIYNYLYTFIMP